MQIAAVVPFERVVVVGIVILLRDLVAAVQNRDAAEREHVGVQHLVEPQRPVELFRVLLMPRGLHAAERRRRAAQARVAETRIIVIQLPARGAAGPPAGEIVVQIALVRNLAHAELHQEAVVEPPADVIVAAEVIQERVRAGKREHLPQLMAQQAHIPCGDGVPGARHGRDVIQQMALRALRRAEIGHDLARLHDDLAQQQRAGADDLADHAHHAHERMDLREIAAARAERFPDVRHGVEPDDVHALIAEIEHVLRHVVKDDGICVV